MKRIVVLMVGLMCAGAVGDEIAAGRRIASGGGPGGEAAACFACHGMNGEGDAAGGFPRLAGLDARYLAKALNDYATGSRPNDIMAPIASALSEEDRRNVSRYYASLPPAAADTGEPQEADLLQHGARLWAEGSPERGVQACIACHGPKAQGLAWPYPALAGQPAAYTTGQLQLWREGTRTSDMASMMTAIAKNLNDRDIEAVAAYIADLDP